LKHYLFSFYEKVREVGLSKSLLEEKGTRNKVYAILWKAKHELELLSKVDNVNWARKKIEHIENDISTLLEICGKPGACNK